MTENKYIQLKKRFEWLSTLLFHCAGQEVPPSEFNEALKSAKHFQADLLSKILRYEQTHKD